MTTARPRHTLTADLAPELAPALAAGHPVDGRRIGSAPQPGGQSRVRAARQLPVEAGPRLLGAQAAGAALATLLMWALVGKHGSAGLTLPGPGISAGTAMVWEAVLTVGLVSVVLGTASGAQQVGSFAAIGVGSYIALAGLWASPVSGASMNPARWRGHRR